MNKMICKKHNLPTVNEAGKMLEKKGFVELVEKRYLQTENNCYKIASTLAEYFGYQPVKYGEIADLLIRMRAHRLGYEELHPRFKHRSPVVLVVRTTDNVKDVHVALEVYGREYNYGATSKDEFTIETHIPLYKKQE